MGITSVKQIVNKTKYPIAFIKLEDTSNRGTLQPHSGYNAKEIWLPWCDNASQFSSKTLILEINEDLRIYIFQKGDFVYYSKVPNSEFSTQQSYTGIVKEIIHPILATPVSPDIFDRKIVISGMGQVDGDRVLIITEHPNNLLINYFDAHLQKL